MDECYEPVGKPFMVTTRNISTGGIALIHNEPIRPRRIIVELPARGDQSPVQVVVKVLRCQSLGSVYEIAGKFVMKAID